MMPTIDPVPRWPGSFAYPGFTCTVTMWTMFPLILEPDWVTLLETITLIRPGSVAGGAELLPVVVVQVETQVSAVGLLAKPFMDDGALPPLKLLSFAHCASQKSTWLPTVGPPAERFPMTKAPVAGGAKTDMVDEALAGR